MTGETAQPVNQRNRGLRWRIHYRNGTTVHSGEKAWDQAHNKDIVAVVWAYNDGPVNVELGTPYYIKRGTWIRRVWDPTLYLRGLGVKFGRWADPELFNAAWRDAAQYVTNTPGNVDNPEFMKGGVVAGTRVAEPGESAVSWRLYYDDLTVMQGSTNEEWDAAPTDGVLVGVYSHVMSGVKLSVAMRRYTFFYWQGNELVNHDDMDRLVSDFPTFFKFGTPSFAGGDYLSQGEAIAAACNDRLEDVP